MRNFSKTRILGVVCLAWLLLWPAGSRAQSSPTVSIARTNATVQQVLREIERMTEYTFFYNNGDFDMEKTVSVSAVKRPVTEIVREMLPDCTCKIENRRIILMKAPAVAGGGKPVSLKGAVKDDKGAPVVGATVLLSDGGQTKGITTSFDGKFAFPAEILSTDATLSVSFIGYTSYQAKIGNRTFFDVVLTSSEQSIDEVVVVGYGVQKKANLTGAVASISQKELQDRPVSSVGRALQGAIPNLNVTLSSGQPGAGASYNIRGNTSPNGGSPLILIDGVETYPERINSNDIESITVLKDAASAAIYGARGAFGVILITTKNPEKGKVRVSYNGSVSLHRRTVIWEDNVVTDPVQWVDAFRESYLNSSPTATVPSLFNNYMPYSNAWFEELKRRRADPTMDNYDIDANGNYNYYGETNWLKEIYKSVNYSTTHAVSIQGGREGVSYYISGRYYNQDGIYKVGEETYKKYNLRAKGSIRIRPWLTLDNNTSLMSSKYHQPMVHYGQQVISRQIDMFAFPFALLKNPDGTWTQTAAKTGYAAFAEGTSWQENNKLEVANTTTFNFEFVPDVF